jgi:hypothetical protein
MVTRFGAPPRNLKEETLDKIHVLRPDTNAGEELRDVSLILKASETVHSLTTESGGDRQKENNGICTSLTMTLLIVNGVILVCALVGGGFILVRYLKKVRKLSEASEYSHVHVCPPEMGSGIRSSSDPNLNSGCATGHVYESIL